MKKILIIPSWYPSVDQPWSGTFFREQAILTKEDFDVRILTGKSKETSRLMRIINMLVFLLKNKVRVNSMSDFYIEPPIVMGFEYAEKVNRFKKLNHRYKSQVYLQVFKSMVKTWKPDLIHAYGNRMGGIISKYISRNSGVPYMITEHNQPAYSKNPFIDEEYLNAMNNASSILMVGSRQKQELESLGVKGKINIIGNYVDEHTFPLAIQKNHDEFTILTVGFYIKEKDYQTLINTIKVFSKMTADSKYRFQIIGCGKDGREKIIKELLHNNIIDLVEIFPYVPREEMPEFHKNCDVFLSTSIYETFGVAMCETMMCGKPVVSTDNGGFDEMFIKGVNGIKCDKGDAYQLAEALLAIQKKEIFFDPDTIRQSVLEKFGTKTFKQRLLNVYNEILNN